MQEKYKRDKAKNRKIGHLSFFLLWIVSTVTIATLSHIFYMWLLSLIAPSINAKLNNEWLWRLVLFDSLLLTSLIAFVEKILLKLYVGQWVKAWISARILSTVISVMPYILLQSFNLQQLAMNNFQNLPLILLTTVLSALPQVWILRRYVKNAWLYFIAVSVTAIIPVITVATIPATSLGASFTVGTASAVIALMMLWFFRDIAIDDKMQYDTSVNYGHLEDQTPETAENQAGEFDIEQKALHLKFGK